MVSLPRLKHIGILPLCFCSCRFLHLESRSLLSVQSYSFFKDQLKKHIYSGLVIKLISLFFIPFYFSHYTHQTVSTMSYFLFVLICIFLICIDHFNLCLEKERQRGRDRPVAQGWRKMLMDTKIDLSYCFHLLNINDLCFKRVDDLDEY